MDMAFLSVQHEVLWVYQFYYAEHYSLHISMILYLKTSLHEYYLLLLAIVGNCLEVLLFLIFIKEKLLHSIRMRFHVQKLILFIMVE
ncbi:hypothetical protein RC88_13330 [Pectobacterium parvum]|nr:hypothetical protein RC88_13330 [Pectobacterium parvum]